MTVTMSVCWLVGLVGPVMISLKGREVTLLTLLSEDLEAPFINVYSYSIRMSIRCGVNLKLTSSVPHFISFLGLLELCIKDLCEALKEFQKSQRNN